LTRTTLCIPIDSEVERAPVSKRN